ncbi:MAG: hypothetical protein IJ193_01690 [Bacilli bacterium]|nr:hypothetical protein [Bacilli bacterium]
MKKRKNFVLLGILLLVAVTSGVVAVTYSRYITIAEGNSSATVAAWRISINGNSTVADTHTFTSNDFTWVNNNSGGNVLGDHIAPGVTGNTTIQLDATNTQVDVEYSITIDTADLVNTFQGYSQLSVVIGSGQSAVTVDFDTATGDPVSYTGNIWLTDAVKTVSIPVSIVWANEASHDEDDTYIGANIDTISIPVSVEVSQYVGA